MNKARQSPSMFSLATAQRGDVIRAPSPRAGGNAEGGRMVRGRSQLGRTAQGWRRVREEGDETEGKGREGCKEGRGWRREERVRKAWVWRGEEGGREWRSGKEQRGQRGGEEGVKREGGS